MLRRFSAVATSGPYLLLLLYYAHASVQVCVLLSLVSECVHDVAACIAGVYDVSACR